MFSIGFARYLPTIPVAPDVAPVTVSPVIKPLLADIIYFELAKSSARIVAVAPDVAPVITSFFWNVPENVSSSWTSLSLASKPKLSVLSNKTKLSVVPSPSKRILSTAVKEDIWSSADSKKR